MIHRLKALKGSTLGRLLAVAFDTVLYYAIWCCIVLLSLLSEVSLQVSVVGFIGDSAVLPCFSKERPLKEITVYWRYNDDLNVYDIIDGQGSVEDQHSAYKGRAEMFSDDFEKGNFSLKLSDLQHNDTGKYICYASDIHTVELLRKNKPSKKKINPSKQKKKETKEHNQDQRRL
ncbi:CD276 antigen homolog [Labeo rohita]|uniref:CD276 antigen homolog n=1 Tax=Labeo rohita TaxID=84645 RepID=UPI0021E31BBC|nr:CD276 antigen homolog [Labeo rohita]